MKYVKLLAIFLVVAGGLVLAFTRGSGIIFGGNKGFAKKDWKGFDKWRERQEDEWKKARGWDEALYIEQYEDIEQKKGGKLITQESYDLAHQTLFRHAVENLSSTFPKYLLQENYSDEKVKEIHKGMGTVVKYEKINLKSQRSLAHIEDVFNFYCNVRKFVDDPHVIGASFNTKTYTWVSFNDRKKKVVEEAKRYRNSPLYAEMNTITDFVNGLNETHLNQVMEKYRVKFYDNLSNKIIAHYDYIVPEAKVDTSDFNQMEVKVGSALIVIYKNKLTKEGRDQLGSLWSKFDDENEGPGNKRLNDFKTRYGNALNAKEAALKKETQTF